METANQRFWANILSNFITWLIGNFTRFSLNGKTVNIRYTIVKLLRFLTLLRNFAVSLSLSKCKADNIFLTERSKLLPSLHYSKNLNMGDIRTSPKPITLEYKNITCKTVHRNQHSRGKSRARSSSPSPVRTHEISPNIGPSATSYFSPQPPSMPLYIVPLPPNPSAAAAHIEKNTRNKTSRRIVRQLLYSIFNKLPLNTKKVGVEAVGVNIDVTEPAFYRRSSRSIATQVLSKYEHEYDNSNLLADEDKYSSSKSSEKGGEWAGPLRALRDSHMRILLHQLGHLRDIERLGKAMCRDH